MFGYNNSSVVSSVRQTGGEDIVKVVWFSEKQEARNEGTAEAILIKWRSSDADTNCWCGSDELLRQCLLIAEEMTRTLLCKYGVWSFIRWR